MSFHLDATVSFNISSYTVAEQDETLQIAVILSNPLSTNADIQVSDKNNTAVSK